MRRPILVSVLGLAALFMASGRGARPSSGEDDGHRGAEQEVRDLEEQFARAVVRGDRAFFEQILADDFTHTSHTGAFKTRAQWLADAKASDPADDKAPRTRYESNRVDGLAVRLYGETAVATGRTTPTGTNAKGEQITGRYRFLRVWVKRQARWQAVAFQGTRIAQP